MEDIIDIIVTETTNLIEITSQPTDEIIDVNIIDNREDVTLNVTPTLVEININSLTGNFGINWGEIEGTLSNQTDLQNALNLKADLVDGKVPSSQLPSYVDDVVEVANYASLPVTGEVGKIYITLDTNFIYRWTGSTYVEIKDSSAVWGAITGTLSNQTDLQSALNAKQDDLNGTGFVKALGTTISYDNSTYALDSAVVKLTGSQSIAGDKRFLDNAIFDYGIGLRTPAGLYQYFEALNGGGYRLGVVTAEHDFYFSTANNYSYSFPAASGTIALTSNLSAYLPLGGGTMTGVLFGASASFSGYVGFGGNTSPLAAVDVTGAGIFSSSVKATRLILSGGTSPTGLYFGHTDKVVLANYTVGGGIDFETNGGNITMQLSSGGVLSTTGGAIFSGALSGTSATFSGLLSSNGGDFRVTSGGLSAIGVVLSSNYDVISNPKSVYTSYGQSTILGGHEFRSVNGSGTGSITSAYGNPSGSWIFYYNVGIGSIPSAWGSSWNPLQTGSYGGFISGRTDDNSLFIGKNVYYNGTNWIGTTTGYANQMFFDSSGNTVFRNNSVTAGAATGFNETIRITYDAILQLTSTASIPTTNNSIYSYSGNNFMYIQGGSAGLGLSASGSRNNIIYVSESSNYVRFDTSGSERMRITSSGDIQTNGNPVYAYNGSISIGGTYQTIFAAVSGGVYLVSVTTDSADGTFGLLTVVNDPDKSLGMIYGNNISLQFSGNNVQMKSTNGSTYNTTWTATRLK